MTDLATIRIPVDSSDMVQAVRESKNLERGIKMLVDAFDAGVIGAGQFSKGLLQLEREYQDLFTSSQQATAAVRGHAKSLQESAAAAEQAAAAKNNLAMATKKAETAFALANQKAKEELQTLRNRAEFAWAMAMQREKESQNAVQAAARQAQAEAKLTAEILRRRQAQEASNAANAQAFQAQIGGNLGLGARGISAASSASVMEAEIERLRLKFDAAYAGGQLFEQQLQEINTANRLGVITDQQREQSVAELTARFQQFERAVAAGDAGALRQFAHGIQESQKGLARYGVVMQQTGYQVGDFLVQVQSGTNAFVAFGQQATQLAGLLTMSMNPKIVALGAALSIVIPLVTAVAGFVLNMRSASDAAEKNSEKMTTLSEAIGRLDVVQQAMTTSLRGNLIAAFGESSEAVGGLINKLREAEFEAAIRPVRSAIDQITVGIDQVNIAVENFEAFRKMEEQGVVLSGVQQRLLEESRVLIERNLSLALAYDSVREAVDKIGQSKSTEDLVANFAQAIEIAESLGGPVANELVKKLIAAAEEAGILPEAIKQAQSAAEDFNNTNMSDGLKDALSVAQQLALATREALFPQQVGRGDPRDFENDPYWQDRYMPDPQKFDLDKKDKNESGSKGQMTTLQNKLEEVYKYLELDQYLIEQEKIAFEQRQDVLQSALDQKLITLEEYNQIEKDLMMKHQHDLANIENQARMAKLSIVLGSGAEILQALGQHNEKAAKMARVFGAAQALADTYAGAAAALKLPFPANLAAAASIISTGLGFVAAIKSGSTASAKVGSVRGGRGSATVAPTAAAPTPQTVMIDSIDPDSLYSGQTLINLFDAFYDENDKRGKVFVVAR